jgi:Na+/H+ antiporter NhaC
MKTDSSNHEKAVRDKNGRSWEKLGEENVKGISPAMSTIMFLLMVGALIAVAFVGISNALGLSPAITAGAVISGAYFVYFLYCIFNFINPILAMIFGFVGINVQRLDPEVSLPHQPLAEVTIVGQDK